MTTARQIVTMALRDIGVLIADSAPQAADEAIGLERLQSLLPHLEQEYGGVHLYPVDAVAGLTLVGGERVSVKSNATMTVTLPARPADGSRVEFVATVATSGLTIAAGGSLRIAGAASANPTLAAGGSVAYTYLAHRGEWVPIVVATATADIPYPPEFDLLISAKLAMMLVSIYDVPAAPADVQERAALCDIRLAERYAPRLKRRIGRTMSGDKLKG